MEKNLQNQSQQPAQEDGFSSFQDFFQQAPAAIAVVHGPQHQYTFSNVRYEKLFNRSRQELMGKTIREVFPEVEGQGVYEIFDQVYSSAEAFVADEFPVAFERDHEGEFKSGFFNFIAQPIRNSSGEVTDIMIHAFEVTDQVLARRKLKESEAYYRQMADLMPDKITNNDPQGNPIYFNQAWRDFLGRSTEEMKTSPWGETIHPDDLPRLLENWDRSIKTGKAYEIEYRIQNKEGVYLWQLTRGVPVKDEAGNIKMWITAATDIQKLKEEDKRKEVFLKMVSHELKTPVTSIKGYVQLLLALVKQKEEELPPSLPLESSLHRIDQQVNRLTRLISEILDLSRLEYDKLQLNKEKININTLVDETVQDILFASPQQKIEVTHNFQCEIMADKDRLGQVLINFITNAVKYSPGDRTVEVEVSQGPEGKVAVSVKDKGIGIDEKDLQKIFQRFYRSERAEEDTYSGFGIGLFLAKEIIERHQGEIRVESTLGEGSVFTFLLPCL